MLLGIKHIKHLGIKLKCSHNNKPCYAKTKIAHMRARVALISHAKPPTKAAIILRFTLRLKLFHSLPQSLTGLHIKFLHVFSDSSVEGFLCDSPRCHFQACFAEWVFSSRG